VDAHERLAHLFEGRSTQKKRLISALTYPAVTFLGAVLVLFGILIFVLPTMMEMITTLNIKLNPILLSVLDLIGFFTSPWVMVYMLEVVGVGIYLLARWSSCTRRGRQKKDEFLVSAPLLGPLMRNAYVSRVCFSLSSMLNCGCDLLTTLRLTAESVGNACFAKSLNNVHERVVQGDTLTQAFQQEPLYPKLFRTFVAIGEESSSVGGVLSKVNLLLEEQLLLQLETYMTLIEPLMITVMGGMVASIVLLFFLPMLQLIDQL
jgi:type IV pilus assembly protein PilC